MDKRRNKMKIGDMTIVVRIKVEMSFWDALKLRIAGMRSELIENIFKLEKSYKEDNEPIKRKKPSEVAIRLVEICLGKRK